MVLIGILGEGFEIQFLEIFYIDFDKGFNQIWPSSCFIFIFRVFSEILGAPCLPFGVLVIGREDYLVHPSAAILPNPHYCLAHFGRTFRSTRSAKIWSTSCVSTTHCRHEERLTSIQSLDCFYSVGPVGPACNRTISLHEVKVWCQSLVLVLWTNRQSLILRFVAALSFGFPLQVLGSGPNLCQLRNPESHGVPPDLSSPVPLQYQVQQAAGSEDTWWPGRVSGPSDLCALVEFRF